MAREKQIAKSALQATFAYITRRYDGAQSARLVVYANTALVAVLVKSAHPTYCVLTTVAIEVVESALRTNFARTILQDQAARSALLVIFVHTIFSSHGAKNAHLT